MASPPGGQYVFSSIDPVNLALSADSTFPPATNEFDIAVFTTTPTASPPADYEGAAIALGGTLVNDFLVADSLTLLGGNYLVSDAGGLDTITAGSGDQSIVGGSFTTIVGGTGPLNIVTGDRNTVLLGTAPSATVNALFDDSVATQGELVNIGAGPATVFANNGDTVNAGSGLGTVLFLDNTSDTVVSQLTISGATAAPTYTVNSASGASLTGGASAVVATAAAGDTIQIGAANSSINALSGPQTIALGSGNATVYSAGTDVLAAGAGQVDVVFADDTVSPETDTVFSSLFLGGVAAGTNLTVSGVGGSTLFAAADSINAVGQAGDSIQIGGASAATVNALAGNMAITLGAGNTTVYSANGDTISAGLGADTITFGADPLTDDAVTVSGGPGGAFTVQSATEGALFGFAANLDVQSYGAETIVAGSVANATINTVLDTVGQQIILGTGTATVFAGGGDTILAGAGAGSVVFAPDHGMTLTGGAAPTGINLLVNSTVTGGVVSGSALSANITGAAGDSIFVGAGSQTVNAIAGNQLVIFGGVDSVAGDSIWGGTGDTIGVGALAPVATVGGTALLLDSTVDGAGAVGFGSFAALATSQVQVTVGTVSGGAVSEGFDAATGDFFFYQGSNDATDDAIIAAATDVTIDTVASVLFTLPDGTQMTVIGVTQADLNNTMFVQAPVLA